MLYKGLPWIAEKYNSIFYFKTVELSRDWKVFQIDDVA